MFGIANLLKDYALLQRGHLFNMASSSISFVKKKKLSWVNFKVLIAFFQWLLNRAASHLADRKELWGAVQDERLL